MVYYAAKLRQFCKTTKNFRKKGAKKNFYL